MAASVVPSRGSFLTLAPTSASGLPLLTIKSAPPNAFKNMPYTSLKTYSSYSHAAQYIANNPEANNVPPSLWCLFNLDEIRKIVVEADRHSYRALGFTTEQTTIYIATHRKIYREKIYGIADVIYYAAAFHSLDSCTLNDALALAGSPRRLKKAIDQCVKNTACSPQIFTTVERWASRMLPTAGNDRHLSWKYLQS